MGLADADVDVDGGGFGGSGFHVEDLKQQNADPTVSQLLDGSLTSIK
jgi:hypothetical protein